MRWSWWVRWAKCHKRRRPETTALYQLVLLEWNTFTQGIEAGERVLPRFCVREVEGYLRCGILGFGFARVHCDTCRKDEVVAFSCKVPELAAARSPPRQRELEFEG